MLAGQEQKKAFLVMCNREEFVVSRSIKCYYYSPLLRKELLLHKTVNIFAIRTFNLWKNPGEKKKKISKLP